MSSFEFGTAFRPRVVPPPPPPPPSLLDSEELAKAIAEAVYAAVSAVVLPAPQVNVEGPDISELVNAVVGLRGPATAEEIAEALAPLVRPPGQGEPDVNLAEVLAELKKSLETLDFRMKGIGTQAYGGGAVKLEPGQVVTAVGGASESTLNTRASEATLVNLKRGISDARILMDYAGRLDSLPVYVGKATQDTAQSDNTWSIQRLSYDGTNRLTDAQVLTGAWTNRATLGWV